MKYADLLDAAERLRNQLQNVARAGDDDNLSFKRDRELVVSEKELEDLVPSVVRNSRNTRDVDAQLKTIARGDGSWAKRTQYVTDEFSPLLDYLEPRARAEKKAPHATTVDESLERLDSAAVNKVWQKAVSVAESDPEHAITLGRNLVESTCKHLLKELGIEYADKEDLSSLYKKTAKALSLAPDQHKEQVFKQVLSGAFSVVDGLAQIRNAYGDAHGRTKGAFQPKPRHARLVVNSAGTLAGFLVETWAEGQRGSA